MAENKIYNLLFLGPSGSGKDTQAGLITKFLEERDGFGSVLNVYTGDVLRELAKGDAYIAKFVHKIVVERGFKIPDIFAAWSIGQVLINGMKENQHLVFSGSPRSVIEVQLLNEFLSALGRENIYYIYLNVSREEVVRRLSGRGRPDDTTEAINNRIGFFEKSVLPALEYCRAKSPYGLIEIDGNPHDQEKIHKAILKAIGLE